MRKRVDASREYATNKITRKARNVLIGSCAVPLPSPPDCGIEDAAATFISSGSKSLPLPFRRASEMSD